MATKSSSSHFQKILIAIDGSPQSDWATRVASQLADQLGAQVLLVHVVVPSTHVSGDYITAQRAEVVCRQFGTDLLRRVRATFPRPSEVSTAQRTGLPSEEIAAEARSWGADLVVVGRHGPVHLVQFVLGGTADAVIRQSSCPVLTVSQEPKPAPEQRFEWNGVGADSADPISAHDHYVVG